MKVFAYLRVSGKGQITGTGFDRQLQTIRDFCAREGHKIEQVFREQVSGTTDEADRDEFRAMVAEIIKDGVDTIVVESLDRLAREYRIQEQLLVYLASKGINLISANTGENVTQAIQDDPMKKAMVQMQGIFAELDKSLTVKKLRKARERIREETGKCEGRKGYLDTDAGRQVIREIKRLRRKPRGGRPRMKYDDVAEELNRLGYRAATGKPFTGDTVKAIMFRIQKAGCKR